MHRVAARVGGMAQRDDRDLQPAPLERGDLLRDERLGEPRVALENESYPQNSADARDARARRGDPRLLDPGLDQVGDVFQPLEKAGHHHFGRKVLALRALPRQNLPSEVVVPGLLEGLQNVSRLVEPWLEPLEADAEARPARISRIG